MATYVFDIDGTVVDYHTNEWLPGAKEFIKNRFKEGHQIVFMTQRGIKSENPIWGMENTYRLLDELKIDYKVVFDCTSPRIIFNDCKDEVVTRKQNDSWIN